MNSENITCPHCNRHVTITDDRRSQAKHVLGIKNADGRLVLVSLFRVCPNPECCKFSLQVSLHEARLNSAGQSEPAAVKQVWQLVPESKAKVFPSYIPAPLLADYREACLIEKLSPKASATLSRRCLQGMLRDFWGVSAGKLYNEIQQIKDKVDPDTWSAIDGLRDLGNIGAHMKADIDVIVDVDPNEARLLVQLVETLFNDWYVSRHDRKQRMAAITNAAAVKKSAPAIDSIGSSLDGAAQSNLPSPDPE